MVVNVNSLGFSGISGYTVSVECSIAAGLPSFDVVGLPDTAVKESRDRVRAACKNCGMNFPVSRVTVNLAPADTRKAGTAYDLPILLGILAASEQIPMIPDDCAFLGELSLTGGLRRVNGVLSMAIAAEKAGIRKIFVPSENVEEASFADRIEVYGLNSVVEYIEYLRSERELSPAEPGKLVHTTRICGDMSDVKGQALAKRALEIAAAGGHNVLMIGPPGTGKSMLAKRIGSILPDMTRDETLESSMIFSAAGLNVESPILTERPFRAPHHTASAVALTGGTSNPRPGEISLAHNGVLFLDELPEFAPKVLETLRQPLEDGQVTISRAASSVTYPASFMLVCAMNPCRCGWYTFSKDKCRCTPESVRRYLSRVSGPMLDRIDIIVSVMPLEFSELTQKGDGEPSAVIKARVDAARRRQIERTGGVINAHMDQKMMNEFCRVSDECKILLHDIFVKMNVSARSYDKILRLARTIADLDGEPEILPDHIAEAVHYRTGDMYFN